MNIVVDLTEPDRAYAAQLGAGSPAAGIKRALDMLRRYEAADRERARGALRRSFEAGATDRPTIKVKASLSPNQRGDLKAYGGGRMSRGLQQLLAWRDEQRRSGQWAPLPSSPGYAPGSYQVDLYVTPEQRDLLVEEGAGNLSEGVRRLVDLLSPESTMPPPGR